MMSIDRNPRARRLAALPRQAGFSLIEILIVITLIGIVATLVIGNVAGGFGQGQAKAAKAQVSAVAMGVERYYMDHGTYPDRLDDLVEKPGGSTSWNGPYVTRAQLLDPWKTPLEYRYPGQKGDFDVVSLGKDKRAGGEGQNADVGNWE
jgi:general secretion pathway protein G